MNLDSGDIRDLRLAGLLHDVGKIAIQTNILQKPDRLSSTEYENIKQHPASGSQIVEGIENSERMSAAIRHHHERWDGTGYPDGLKAESIPLLARILALADAFDSMYAGRPYKDSLSMTQVLAEVQQTSGTQFDPNVAAVFVRGLSADPAFQGKINKVYSRAHRVATDPGTAARSE